MKHPRWIAFLVVAGLTSLSYGKDEDEPVYNNIPAERLEKILTGLKFEFKKVPGKKEMVDYYDLKRDGVTLRMHNYSGQDLWLESVFTEKLSLDDVNRWNTRAKYSRAVMLKKAEHPTVSLEAQLDCIGGVTDAIVRNYITRLQTDVAAFAKFANKNRAIGPLNKVSGTLRAIKSTKKAAARKVPDAFFNAPPSSGRVFR